MGRGLGLLMHSRVLSQMGAFPGCTWSGGSEGRLVIQASGIRGAEIIGIWTILNILCIPGSEAGGTGLLTLGEPGEPGWGNQRKRRPLPFPIRNRVRTLLDKSS